MIVDTANLPQTVNNVFYFILAISVVLLVFITFLMVFFVIKYHRTRNKEPEDIEGNTWLEITWTVIPTIIVLAMFYYGWVGYKLLKDVPADAMVVNVTGRMWSWLFEYDNGVQSDTLYLPIDKAVRLDLQSQDVLHSFFVPAFRVKQDVVPGLEEVYLWLHPRELGSFDVLCAEYCGQQHAYMLTRLVVMPDDKFQNWLAAEWDSLAGKDSTLTKPDKVAREESKEKKMPPGLKLLWDRGCIACHTTDGSVMVSTSFKNIFGKKQIVISDGKERKITIDEAYFKKSILEPKADVVKGLDPFMPELDEPITDEEVQAMIEYIKSLK